MICLILVLSVFGQSPFLNAIVYDGEDKIVSYLDDQVLLCMEGNADFFPRERASAVLNSFFKEQKPIGQCRTLYKKNYGSGRLVVANVRCSTGSYRVHILLEERSWREVITEIKITKN